MRRLSRLAGIAFAALMSACAANAGGPPEIQVDRSSCSHCTMLISEARYAAAYHLEGKETRIFDDIGCLLDALKKEGNTPSRFWFMDANAARWIDGERAVFVRSEEIRTPMSGGITAYADQGAAERAASKYHGAIVKSLAELRAGKQ